MKDSLTSNFPTKLKRREGDYGRGIVRVLYCVVRKCVEGDANENKTNIVLKYRGRGQSDIYTMVIRIGSGGCDLQAESHYKTQSVTERERERVT